MADLITITEGLDLRLSGAADFARIERSNPVSCTLIASDFPGPLWVPVVERDAEVSAGTVLARARMWPDVCLVSPVAGKVAEVCCDDCGVLEYARIEADSTSDATVRYEIPKQGDAGYREALVTLLGKAGLWALMRCRPYDVLPDPDVVPRDVFVTAFDSAPLAGPLVSDEMLTALETGIEALGTLTSGRVYLGVPYDSDISSRVAVVTEFRGPHPAGNSGIQAGLLLPVNRGETIWTLDARTVVRIGRLLESGLPDFQAEVTVAGEAALNPCVVITRMGAAVSDILAGHLPVASCRIVSGNPLSGYTCDLAVGSLRYPFRQISLLAKENNAPCGLWRRLKAYISSEPKDIFPLDISCDRLLDAIETRDPALMEAAGIYEVAPDDFSVTEYYDPRHRPVQALVREGLTYMQTYESRL